jgi:hypothetical protein
MEFTVITFIGWVSRRKLVDLTLSRTPGPAPRPRPLSVLSPPPLHHPTPTTPPTGSFTPPPPLQPAPPQAPPRPGHPVAPVCCRPRLSHTLSLTLEHGPHTHATVAWSAPAASPAIACAGLPSCPPPPGRCSAPALLPRPPALTPSADAASPDAVDRHPAQLGLPRPAPDRSWTLPLASFGRSSTRLSPPADPRRCPPPLAAAQLLGHPTWADGFEHHRPN